MELLASLALVADHLFRRLRQRRARLRLFVAYGAGRPRVLRQPGAQPGAGADRGVHQPVRAGHQPGGDPRGMASRHGRSSSACCPGVALGSYLLASIHPDWLKLGTYVLSPAAHPVSGGRRASADPRRDGWSAFRSARAWLPLFGDHDLRSAARAAVQQPGAGQAGVPRRASRSSASPSRASRRLPTASSASLPPRRCSVGSWIVPSVLIGIPLGAFVIRRIDAETFRRVCMSFDVWVVGFGLSRALIDLKLGARPGRLQRDGGRRAARPLSAVRLLQHARSALAAA